VDEAFGVPVEWNEFVKSREPRFPVEGISYETGIDGLFVGGWSRQASHGLVGYARKDGISAARAVLQYLQTRQPGGASLQAVLDKARNRDKLVITKEEIKRLETAEAAEAKKRGLDEFRFSTNEEMVAAIGSAETA
jgi:ferredoxin--NADP+ reductase